MPVVRNYVICYLYYVSYLSYRFSVRSSRCASVVLLFPLPTLRKGGVQRVVLCFYTDCSPDIERFFNDGTVWDL